MQRVRPVVAAAVVVGAAVTAAGTYAVHEASGVYVATARVAIVPPPDQISSNRYTSPTGSAVAVAGVVAKMVDPTDRPKFASPDATLVGSGVKHGSWVKLPDTGGQWASAFSDPWLDVEVVDTDSSRVEAVMAQRLDQIQRTLDALQEQAAVRPRYRFTTEVVPASGPQVDYRLGRANAGSAMTLVLGSGLTIALYSWLARGRRGRARPAVDQDPAS